jgi:GNAT superfamily N-acetyltransferase
MSLTIRLAGKEDEPFLNQLAYDEFYDILCAWAWDPVTRESLLRIQIDGQRASYRSQYPNSDHGIIMLDNRAIGRIIIDRGPAFDTLVDILITRQKRGAGVGTWLLRSICMEADLRNQPIHLQVRVNNRAKHLYERLGFHSIEQTELWWRMERRPNTGERIVAP